MSKDVNRSLGRFLQQSCYDCVIDCVIKAVISSQPSLVYVDKELVHRSLGLFLHLVTFAKRGHYHSLDSGLGEWDPKSSRKTSFSAREDFLQTLQWTNHSTTVKRQWQKGIKGKTKSYVTKVLEMINRPSFCYNHFLILNQ